MLFDIAPPLSCTTNHPPFGLSAKAGIYITVPILYPFPAATVYHADAFAPEAVIPFVLPQHFAQEQYAEVLSVLTVGVIPCTFFASVVEAVSAGFEVATLSSPPLDVTCIVLTSTILFTGSLIIVLEISVLSISSSFWYFILYVTSLKPFLPLWTTLFCFVPSPVASFVIVSNGITSCSVTNFSTIVPYELNISSAEITFSVSAFSNISSILFEILIVLFSNISSSRFGVTTSSSDKTG